VDHYCVAAGRTVAEHYGAVAVAAGIDIVVSFPAVGQIAAAASTLVVAHMDDTLHFAVGWVVASVLLSVVGCMTFDRMWAAGCRLDVGCMWAVDCRLVVDCCRFAVAGTAGAVVEGGTVADCHGAGPACNLVPLVE
jgi:hypothetical protein